MIVTACAQELVWQDWNEVYIVYQPSSAETHVLNETTSLILRSVQEGPLSEQAVKDWTEIALGFGQGDLDADDFAFAMQRLEELGLIEYLDEVRCVQ